MWLSEKAAQRREDGGICRVGTVSSGGLSPKVVFGGEAMRAALPGKGAVYVPKAGDEVLTVTSDEGDCFIIGAAGAGDFEAEKGELVIRNSGGAIRLKADGSIELSGAVRLSGTLIVNGKDYS